jgi:hypothetical protein
LAATRNEASEEEFCSCELERARELRRVATNHWSMKLRRIFVVFVTIFIIISTVSQYYASSEPDMRVFDYKGASKLMVCVRKLTADSVRFILTGILHQ